MLSTHLAGSDFAPPGGGPNRLARAENRVRSSALNGSRPDANQAPSFRRPPREQSAYGTRDRRLPPPRREGRLLAAGESRPYGNRPAPGRPEFRPPPPGRDGFRPPHEEGGFPPLPPHHKPGAAKPEYRVSYALLDRDKKYVVGDYPQNREYVYMDIPQEEETIGFLAVSKRNELTKGYELDFLEQQQHYLWFIAVLVMLLVILVTLPLARHLVQPIRQLTSGMHKLTQGDYRQSLDLKRRDEFGMLSRDFNELATTLEQNESARKRWLANISHELRTPVAILRGELEAMIDGIRTLSQEGIESANQEVMHLQRLIEDLHQLTSADIGGMTYRKQKLDLTRLLVNEQMKYQGYLADVGLDFKLAVPVQAVWIHADKTRFCQLLDNLVNNCIKYASSGSQVRITLERNQEKACLYIEDDGPGVDDKHLAHLFEHLYRTDDSRNSQTGGTGLGLSICSHIVAAHQGEICANHSTLGGLKVTISLPII
ncbi:HAMP domain-containing protein [Thalassomonas viridans]|uniref:histidine kinase n=2 Tax=Thalassomonas viridans TaxID=137584 RepID=A0AAE9ZB98_9GAMM|nr:HAMP domain-containing protein [Thalassomonas viridans]